MKSKTSRADMLLFAAFVVAAPRFMGVFGMAVGKDLVKDWPLFASAEVWSGLAMALLEGLALAYISKRWRKLEAHNFYWKLLLGFQVGLILALPLTVTPYLVATQLGLPVIQVLAGPVFWAWNFLVAAISPLVAVAVGIVEDEKLPASAPTGLVVSDRLRAWDVLLSQGQMTPDQLGQRLNISPDVADQFIQEFIGAVKSSSKRNGKAVAV